MIAIFKKQTKVNLDTVLAITYMTEKTMEERREIKAISDKKLREIIWEKITVSKDGKEQVLTMPWHFGKESDEKSEPLKITVKHVKLPRKSVGPERQRSLGSVVDTQQYESFEISDGGRAFIELERKVGDITPYLPRIKRILYKTGMNELRGGRIITKTYDLYSPWITLHHLDGFVTAITIIANLDILPPFTNSKWSSEARDIEEKQLLEGNL